MNKNYADEDGVLDGGDGPAKLVIKKNSDGNPYPRLNDKLTEDDLAQLKGLDKEIERLFEMQIKKRNKNDDMIRNKI